MGRVARSERSKSQLRAEARGLKRARQVMARPAPKPKVQLAPGLPRVAGRRSKVVSERPGSAFGSRKQVRALRRKTMKSQNRQALRELVSPRKPVFVPKRLPKYVGAPSQFNWVPEPYTKVAPGEPRPMTVSGRKKGPSLMPRLYDPVTRKAKRDTAQRERRAFKRMVDPKAAKVVKGVVSPSARNVKKANQAVQQLRELGVVSGKSNRQINAEIDAQLNRELKRQRSKTPPGDRLIKKVAGAVGPVAKETLTGSKQNALDDVALRMAGQSKKKVRVAGVDVDIPAAARALREARSNSEAASLVALEQLTRVSSGSSKGISQALSASKRKKSPGSEFIKGFGKGFKENNYGYGKLLQQAGASRGVAATLGFVLDVALDPTTYVTLGAGAASKAALRAAAEGAGRRAVREGLDRATAVARMREAIYQAERQARSRSASAAALSRRGEGSAVKAQRQQLAGLERAGRGNSAKAQRIRRNLGRAGKKDASRAARAEREALDAGEALRALRSGRARSRFDRLPTVGGKARRTRRGVVRGSKAETKQRFGNYAVGQEIRRGSDFIEGRTFSAGFGSRRLKISPREKGLVGKFKYPSARRVPRSGEGKAAKPKAPFDNPVSYVSPVVRPSSEVPERQYGGVRESWRVERAGRNKGKYEAKSLYEEVRRNLPSLDDETRKIWISVYERLDQKTLKGLRRRNDGWVVGEDNLRVPDEFAAGYVKNGRLVGSKRIRDRMDTVKRDVQRSGQPVGDIRKIRTPDVGAADNVVESAQARVTADRGAVREAEGRVRRLQSQDVRARASEARSGAVARERLRARDRQLIAALPKKHPLRKALRNMLEARTEVTKAGKRLRNVKSKGPQARKSKRAVDNSELKFKDTPEGAQARYDAARARYAATRQKYAKELERFRAETDAQFGRGEEGGAEQFSRQGESVALRKVSDAASDRVGIRAEMPAAKQSVRNAYKTLRESKQELKQARVARRGVKRRARKVRPLAEGDVRATAFYPHRKMMQNETYAQRVGYRGPGGSAASGKPRSRGDVRPIDQINAQMADDPRVGFEFSTDPASDTASQVQAMREREAYNNSLNRLASYGTDVKFKGFAGRGERETVPEFYKRYQIAPDGLGGNKVYRLGTRNGRYQLDEVGSDELTHLIEGVRKNAKGKEFPVSPKGRYVVLDDAAVAVFNAAGPRSSGRGAKSGEILSSNIVGRFYDRVSQGMRRLAIFTPQYHAVNELGDTWIMYTVVPAYKIPFYKTKAIPVLRYLRALEAEHHKGGLLSPLAGSKRLGEVELFVGDRTMTVKQIADDLDVEGAARQGQFPHFVDTIDPANRSVTVSADDPTKAGRSIRASLNRGRDRVRESAPVDATVSAGRAAGRLVRTREDWNRVATYLYLKDEGFDSAGAAQKALDALIDYGELTDVERRLFRRLVFFYTFPARQIPYQTKVLLTRPGKFAAYEKLRVAFANAQNIDLNDLKDEPWWVQANVPIPVRIGGEVRWLSANLPLNLLNQSVPLGANWPPNKLALNDTYFAITSLTPAVRVPLEALSNRNYFFRSDISSSPGRANQTAAPWFVVQLAKADPKLKKALGIYRKPLPSSNGKPVWVMDKNLAWWVGQLALGPLRQASEYGKFVGESGASQKERLFRFGTGIRGDRSQADREAVNRLKVKLDKVRREIANMEGDETAIESNRYTDLIEQEAELSAAIAEVSSRYGTPWTP